MRKGDAEDGARHPVEVEMQKREWIECRGYSPWFCCN